MLPQQLEYLTLLAFLVPLLCALFGRQYLQLIKKVDYWISLVLFLGFCVALELVALHLAWWYFIPEKICGIWLMGVPLEEYVLFAGFHALVLGSWKLFDDELA